MSTVSIAACGLRRKLPILSLLGLSSLMSLVLLGFRIYYTGSSTYIFLAWNLCLAWVPLVCALLLWLLAQQRPIRPLALLILFSLWILFFPNAPYIVTDMLHLRPRNNFPIWYDLVLLFSFAWTGLLIGFVSLWTLQSLVRQRVGAAAGWALAGFTLAASSFGIYLGRFQRWNSWDLLTNPFALGTDILTTLTHPAAYRQTFAVTLLFSGFLIVSYLTMVFLAHTRWHIDP